MKLNFFVIIIIATLGLFASQGLASQDVLVNLEDGSVGNPGTSRTQTTVLVKGNFPSTCFNWKSGVVKNISAFEHEITGVAVDMEMICLQVLTPFEQEISLGRLAQGTHTLRFISSDQSFFEKTVEVIY